jgi:hypothetical protein
VIALQVLRLAMTANMLCLEAMIKLSEFGVCKKGSCCNNYKDILKEFGVSRLV